MTLLRKWITYTNGTPIAADFLTTAGSGPTICIDATTGLAYYLFGTTPTLLNSSNGTGRLPKTSISVGAAIGDLGDFGGTGLGSIVQINSTDQSATGIQTIIWGNHSKGVQDYVGKSRGASIGTIAAVQLGDRVYAKNIQAAGSFGAFGHVGYERWTIDGTPDAGSEMAGRWTLGTGTGNNISEDPTYYGLHTAITANSRQEVYFPGMLTDPSTIPVEGARFGAWIRVGKGGTAANQLPMLFDLSGAALATTPVPGGFEWDSNGTLYMTNSAGTRAAIGGGGGGGTTVLSGTVSATVPAGSWEWEETLTAASVTTLMKVYLTLAPTLSSDENTAEMLNIQAMSATPNAGSITVNLSFGEPTSGAIKLNWSAI